MPRALPTLLVLLAGLLVTGCGESAQPDQRGTAAPPPAVPSPPVAVPAPGPVAVPVPAVAPSPAPAAAAKAKHVVVLVIDGARFSETFGDPTHQYIPHLATELAAQGAVWTDFANDGPTYTEAGHAALTTGFYQEIDNTGRDLPRHPSLFQLLVKANGGDAGVAWLITTKDKLATLSDCKDPAWNGQFQCRSDCGRGGKGVGAGYREDAETWQRVSEILPKEHPRYTLINLKQPDASGHGKNWEGYLQGIRDGDATAKKLWDLIQGDPVYRGTTDLFITDDHGRHLDGHKDGYVSHGDDCAGCRHIMLVALGPDVPAGSVFAVHRSLVDVAATAAWILGLQLEGSPGHRLDELWAPPAK